MGRTDRQEDRREVTRSMGAKAPRKFDKSWNPMPGFRASSDVKREMADKAEEHRDRQRVKDATKRLRAEGFEFDKLTKHAKRFSR